jgi:putative ABC transport system permease protein
MISSLRLALRTLGRNPAPTFVIVLTLAVAIGVSTIIGSMVDSVWHALPVADTERLVFVSSTDPRPGEARAGMAGDVAITGTSIPDLVDWTARSTTVDDFAAFQYATATLTGLDAPERASIIRATANLPAQWQIPIAIGRGFKPEDGRIGALRVALLTDRYWRERFAARPNVIGTSVFLDGVPHTLVGVVSASAGRGIFVDTDMWVPQALDSSRASRDARTLFVSARLKPGATLEQADRDFSAIAEQLKTEYPTTNAQTGIVVRPLVELLGGGIPFLLSLLMLIAALVVAMACTNVSNVVLAQVSGRRRELSLRTVLGAGRWDHVQQIMAEGFVLSAAAGLIGLVLGAWGLTALKWLGGPQARVLTDATINGRILAAGVITSFLIPFAFSLLPALRGWRPDANDLRQGARATQGPGHRMRTVLVALQVGLAVVLLVQVALLGRMAWTMRAVGFGLDPSQVLTFKLDVSPARFPDPESVTRFYSALLDRIGELPGVASAGAINRLPVADRDINVRVRVDDAPPVSPEALPSLILTSVSSDYLRTMRVPVLRGRALAATDFSGGQSVALVSEDAARQLWPRGNTIGSRATLTLPGEPDRTVQVIGVVANLRSADVFRRSMAHVFVPWTLRPDRTMAVAIRTEAADPIALAPAVRAAAAALEPNEPVFAVSSMEQVIFNDLASQYVLTGLIIAVGFLALCLAAAGIYGVVSYAAVQRTREIGVRMALGARPSAVRRMIVTQGAWPVIGGWLLGLPLSLPIAFAMAGAFAFITASDPINYLVVLVSIALVALASCYLPARRASRIDPVIALRAE